MFRFFVVAALVGMLGFVVECRAQGPGGRARGGGSCGAGGGSSMTRRSGNTQSALAQRAVFGSANGSNSGGGSQAKVDPEQTRQAVLKIYDTDYDGTLNDVERAKLIDAMKLRGYSNAYIGRFFANILGMSLPTTRGEQKQVAAGKLNATKPKAGTKLQGEMLAKYDTNADGKLSVSEKIAMRQAIAAESKSLIE